MPHKYVNIYVNSDMNLRSTINIDTTNKCSLKCPACTRQARHSDGNFPGGDISLDDFRKLAKHFDTIHLNGQLSDPTLHEDFHSLLKICIEENTNLMINNASTARSYAWYLKAFNLSKKGNIKWIFAIDGLPEDSHKYRINQDGKKLYKMMRLCSAMGIETQWNYIIFNYNEDDIENAKKMARSIGVTFNLVRSARWEKELGMDKYKPSDPKNHLERDFFDYLHKKPRVL